MNAGQQRPTNKTPLEWRFAGGAEIGPKFYAGVDYYYHFVNIWLEHA